MANAGEMKVTVTPDLRPLRLLTNAEKMHTVIVGLVHSVDRVYWRGRAMALLREIEGSADDSGAGA